MKTLHTHTGAEDGTAGCRIWVEEGSKWNRAIRIPGNGGTNQQAELIAIMEATLILGPLIIKSDSKTTLEGIIKGHKEWEDHDYINTENAELWRVTISRLRKRGATTKFKWIKAHNGIEGNEKADELAKQGAEKEQEDTLDLTIDERFKIEGARLRTLDQKTTYELIMNKKKVQPGKEKTQESIKETKEGLRKIMGSTPTTKQIWKGLYKEPIDNKISDFLWKIIHNRIKCGPYFRWMEGFEERQYCACGNYETISHILLDCEENNCKEIWEESKKLWSKIEREKEWEQPNIEIIKGIGAYRKQQENGKPDKGTTKRYQILVTETIWTIWKIRNNRIFNNKKLPKEANKDIWKETMRRIILIHWEMIKQRTIEKQNKEKEIFMETWKKESDVIMLDKSRKWITIKI